MVTDGNGNVLAGGERGGKSHITYKPYGEILRTDSYGLDIMKYKYTGLNQSLNWIKLGYVFGGTHGFSSGRWDESNARHHAARSFCLSVNVALAVAGSPLNTQSTETVGWLLSVIGLGWIAGESFGEPSCTSTLDK